MNLDKELTGADLVFTALTMLLGQEGIDFSYMETDENWWTLRL